MLQPQLTHLFNSWWSFEIFQMETITIKCALNSFIQTSLSTHLRMSSGYMCWFDEWDFLIWMYAYPKLWQILRNFSKVVAPMCRWDFVITLMIPASGTLHPCITSSEQYPHVKCYRLSFMIILCHRIFHLTSRLAIEMLSPVAAEKVSAHIRRLMWQGRV